MSGDKRYFKIFSILALLLIISSPLLSLVNIAIATPSFENSYFDFDNDVSPVTQAGYQSVKYNDIYSGATGFGWTVGASSAGRGAGAGRTNATQDLNYENPSRTFKIYVGTFKGTFNLNFTMVDWGYTHWDTISVEGKQLVDCAVLDGTVTNQLVSVYCDDGVLDIVFAQSGTNWVINAIGVDYITDFYDDFTDLSNWTLYGSGTNAVPWIDNGAAIFNTNTSWVSFQTFGGHKQYTGELVTTMPAMYYAGTGANTFSNGTIEFDMTTPTYGPPLCVFMPSGNLEGMLANSTSPSTPTWTSGNSAAKYGAGYNYHLFVTFRMQDENNYYVFKMTWGGYTPTSSGSGATNVWNWQFAKCTTGVDNLPIWTWLSGESLSPPLDANTKYHVVFTISGNTFRAYIPYAGIDAVLQETDSTWNTTTWGGIGIYLGYSPVSPIRIDNFCYSNTVAYPSTDKPLSYFNTDVLQLDDTYVQWWSTEFYWHNIIDPQILTNVRTFITYYAPATFAYMGFNFAEHYVGNYSNPLGNKIAIWIMPGGAGGFCSSGHDGYKPAFASGDMPYLGIGVGSFDTATGAPYISSTLDGYYAYILIAHEWMNEFNFFASVNVPNWMADGHSPLAFTSKTYPLRVAGVAMGGTIGGLIVEMADWELYYGSYGVYDSGVRFINIYNTYYPTAFGKTYQLFREEFMAEGWTIYGNATGAYPIIVDGAYRAAIAEVYFEHGAGVISLPWDYIPYIDNYAGENNATLRAKLSEILFDMRSTQQMLTDYDSVGGDVTVMNATMNTAWEYWRKGYCDDANTTMYPVLTTMLGLGFSKLPALVPSLFNSIVWENNNVATTGSSPIYGNIWVGQTFTTGADTHTLNEVDLKLKDYGTPVNLIVDIRAVNTNHKPTGSVLTTGTITTYTGFDGYWYPVYMAPINLAANTEYAIVCYALGAGGSITNYISLDYATGYANGGMLISSSSGVSWSWDANTDINFFIFGLSSPQVLSLTIFDMDTTNNLYAMYKYYTFVGVGSSLSGADITDMYVTCIKDGLTYFEVHGATLSTTPTYHINSGSTLIQLNTTGCMWAVSGTQGTGTFMIRPMWDFPDASGYDLYLQIISAGADSGLLIMQTAYFDLVSNLVGTMSTTTPSVFISSPATITGTVTYPNNPGSLVSSGLFPPDSIFTRVQLFNLDDQLVAVDSSIVNGTFSIGFTSPYYLQTYTYHIHAVVQTNFSEEPINTPSVDIEVTANMAFLLPILMGYLDSALSGLGVVGGAVAFYNMIVSLSTYFVDSIVVIVSGTVMLAGSVIGFATFFLDWGARTISDVVWVINVVISIFNGTASVATGLGNIWALFGDINNLLDFIPIAIIIGWMGSVDARMIKTGQGLLTIVYGDVSMLYGVYSMIMGILVPIVDRVWGWVQTVVSRF